VAFVGLTHARSVRIGDVLDACSNRSWVGVDRRWRMQAEPREDKVCIWMTWEEAQDLLREIDKWPELPKVERDLVNALKELPRTS
jgi:hypothetical protein